MISCRAHSLLHNCASLALTVMLSDTSFLDKALSEAVPALRWLIHTNSDSPVHHQNLLSFTSCCILTPWRRGQVIRCIYRCGSSLWQGRQIAAAIPHSPLTACEAAQSRNGKRKFNMASPRCLISIQMRHYWIRRSEASCIWMTDSSLRASHLCPWPSLLFLHTLICEDQRTIKHSLQMLINPRLPTPRVQVVQEDSSAALCFCLFHQKQTVRSVIKFRAVSLTR